MSTVFLLSTWHPMLHFEKCIKLSLMPYDPHLKRSWVLESQFCICPHADDGESTVHCSSDSSNPPTELTFKVTSDDNQVKSEKNYNIF